MNFKLPELPYAKNAFDPFLSAESFDFHYGKHHKAYIDMTNQLVIEKGLEGSTLEDLVLTSEGKLFNNAAQAWNHTFFWHCLSPQRTKPSGRLLAELEREAGDYETWIENFVEKGKSQFGSGWVWLVKDTDGKTSVMATPNAENPLRQGKIPLLVADVWEHAYYIDYRNDRPGFLRKLLNHVNWDFVQANFDADKPITLTHLMTDQGPDVGFPARPLTPGTEEGHRPAISDI